MPQPTRQPGSVRDIRENGIKTHNDKPELITGPSWLTLEAKHEFDSLVVSLMAAQVPIKQIDSHAVACCAQCIASVRSWSEREQQAESLKDQLDCSKQVARYQRDSQKWLNEIGGTPAARAKLGIRTNQADADGPLAQMLKAKAKTS